MFDFDAEAGGFEGDRCREGGSRVTESNEVFLGGDDGGGSGLAGGGDEAVKVSRSEAVVVRECEGGSEVRSCRFEAGKKLGGACDAAEGDCGAVDCRDVHLAVQAPDGAFPAPCAQGGLELRGSVRGGDGDNRGAVGGFGRLAQVGRREQGVLEPRSPFASAK